MWIPSDNQRRAQIKFLLRHGYDVPEGHIEKMVIIPNTTLTFAENFESTLDKDTVAFEIVNNQRLFKAEKPDQMKVQKWAKSHRYSDWYEPDRTLELDEVLEDILNEAKRCMQ
jgi:hypothetical protein